MSVAKTSSLQRVVILMVLVLKLALVLYPVPVDFGPEITDTLQFCSQQ